MATRGFKIADGTCSALVSDQSALESWARAAAVSYSIFWEHYLRLSTELGCEQTLVSICLAVTGED